jgi:heterodisulfide reductase subunit A-like polyferredoxin
VEDNLYTCSQDTQGKIKDAIIEHKLNRVIVASCSPRTHEPMFRETCREAGINKYLFEMANIRDQCSWVHMRQKEDATHKAKDLVRMAVAKAALLEPLPTQMIEMNQKALIIGGGLAGMTAALTVGVLQFVFNITIAFSTWMTAGDPLWAAFLTMLPMILLGIIAPVVAKVMTWYGAYPMRHA